ncbi:hypothetical protein [Corynebacterium deserti]|uniref:hypothetical protein n=1 Tax=Corynebacterium deserti TaxID=1408191 RepID=UPI001E47B6FA|nr:hypothetical protein [Corynebacterium deserti]
MRRTSLTLVTATAVALSAFTPVAHAQSSDVLGNVQDNITSSHPLDEDGNPVDGAEQWPGSVEGSSMLSSGELPAAPSLGSSTKKDSDGDGVSDEEQARIDELSQLPVIGSLVDPPGWVSIPFAVVQAFMAITGFAATAASVMVQLNPEFRNTLRDMLTQFGINVDA